MSTSAQIRHQVESALAVRFPAALTVRPPAPPELLSCGVPEVDAVLGGGLPVGTVTELTGAHSSGRTSLVLSALSEVTRQGALCAYVDVSDVFDPLSASAMGVELSRLLWIRAESRPRVPRHEKPAADSSFPAGTPAPVLESKRIGTMGWRHPRDESIGLPQAVGALFQSVPCRQEDFPPRCAEARRRPPSQPVKMAGAPHEKQGWTMPELGGRREQAWERLDHALRATDLLLNTGGFRAIVLDMGDVPPEQARRVPLATWYRFRLQAEKSRTLFLLMTCVPCAGSCAALSLGCEQMEIEWHAAAAGSPRLLAGVHYRVHVERSRLMDPQRKKPAAPANASWTGRALWAR